MLQTHRFLDHRDTVLDKTPKWSDSWAEDFDLDIIPSALEEMAYQAQGSQYPCAPEGTVPLELQRLDSERLQHRSPIDGPVAWGTSFSGPNGSFSTPQPPYYGRYSRPPPPGLNIPENGRHARSWPGGNTDIDASSTISPMSPKTPAAKSEIDFAVATPYTVPHGPGAQHHGHYMEIKQEGFYSHSGSGVSMNQIHPDETDATMSLRGIQGPPAPGTYAYQGPYQTGINPPHSATSYHHNQSTVSPNVLRSPHDQAMDQELEDDEDAVGDVDGELESDYDDNRSVQASTRPPGRRPETRNRSSNTTLNRPLKPQNPHHRINKRPHNPPQQYQLTGVSTQFENHSSILTSSTSASNTYCNHCHKPFGNASTLQKHIQTKHTRPFSCIFPRYGCSQDFGSKNEWARHIRVQHLRLEGWQCDMGKCGTHVHEGDKHSFDRKDLFTQHLRRMHKELYRGVRADDSAERARLEAEVQERCHIALRQPPAGGRCPYCPAHLLTPVNSPVTGTNKTRAPAATAAAATSGATDDHIGTWESFLEHVARHLEKGASGSHGQGEEDTGLRDWLIHESLLQPLTDAYGRTTGYRVVGCDGKKSNTPANAALARVPRAAAPVRRGGRRTRRSTAMEEDEDAEGELDE